MRGSFALFILYAINSNPTAIAHKFYSGDKTYRTAEMFDAFDDVFFFCRQMFDSVSILFSDVVTFTEICSRITPMEVVSMLNGMYSIFDTLTERNNVYKVN